MEFLFKINAKKEKEKKKKSSQTMLFLFCFPHKFFLCQTDAMLSHLSQPFFFKKKIALLFHCFQFLALK